MRQSRLSDLPSKKEGLLAKAKLLIICVFVAIPAITFLIGWFLPERVSELDTCRKKCDSVNRSFRLEPQGPLTTKGHYLEYKCTCF